MTLGGGGGGGGGGGRRRGTALFRCLGHMADELIQSNQVLTKVTKSGAGKLNTCNVMRFRLFSASFLPSDLRFLGLGTKNCAAQQMYFIY